VVIKLRSKRLAYLFTEVWERLPETDQALLSKRTRLVLDDLGFLPKAYLSAWGVAMGIGVKKSISIVYLNPRKLPRQPDHFIRYVIAHELAHIFCDHLDQLFFSPLTDSDSETGRESFEVEADRQARRWGFPIVIPSWEPKHPRSRRKGAGYHRR